MSKFLNIICVILVILLLILPNFVQAMNVDMNLTNTQNNISTNSADSNSINARKYC